jgi:hypothetical protein
MAPTCAIPKNTAPPPTKGSIYLPFAPEMEILGSISGSKVRLPPTHLRMGWEASCIAIDTKQP